MLWTILSEAWPPVKGLAMRPILSPIETFHEFKHTLNDAPSGSDTGLYMLDGDL